MILSLLIAMISQNCSCQLSKLQLRATVIKIKKSTQESVHYTFETDQYDIPKLQRPAIKTIYQIVIKNCGVCGNWFIILSKDKKGSQKQLPATVIAGRQIGCPDQTILYFNQKPRLHLRSVRVVIQLNPCRSQVATERNCCSIDLSSGDQSIKC